jgi:hypothetical protein
VPAVSTSSSPYGYCADRRGVFRRPLFLKRIFRWTNSGPDLKVLAELKKLVLDTGRAAENNEKDDIDAPHRFREMVDDVYRGIKSGSLTAGTSTTALCAAVKAA